MSGWNVFLSFRRRSRVSFIWSGPPRTLNSNAGFFPLRFILVNLFVTNSWPLVGLGLLGGGKGVVGFIPEVLLAVTVTP